MVAFRLEFSVCGSGVLTANRVRDRKIEDSRGRVGGGLPSDVLALFFASASPGMVKIASPFAYFVVFVVIGGFIGAVTGPITVGLVQALRLPLPLQGK